MSSPATASRSYVRNTWHWNLHDSVATLEQRLRSVRDKSTRPWEADMSGSRLVRGVVTLVAAAAVGGAASAVGHTNAGVAGAIVFSSDRAPNLVPQLVSVAEGGSGRKQVTSWDFYGGSFTVSPDRSRVAYVFGRLFETDVNGGAPVPLGEGSLLVPSTAWSPDGNWIAYTTSDDPLHAVAADGSRTVDLGAAPYATRLAWSPDSTQLAVAVGPYWDAEVDVVRLA